MGTGLTLAVVFLLACGNSDQSSQSETTNEETRDAASGKDDDSSSNTQDDANNQGDSERRDDSGSGPDGDASTTAPMDPERDDDPPGDGADDGGGSTPDAPDDADGVSAPQDASTSSTDNTANNNTDSPDDASDPPDGGNADDTSSEQPFEPPDIPACEGYEVSADQLPCRQDSDCPAPNNACGLLPVPGQGGEACGAGCNPFRGCESDTDCADNQVCIEFPNACCESLYMDAQDSRCVERCTEDSCGVEETCTDAGVCEVEDCEPGGCDVNRECNTDTKRCQWLPCNSDDDCECGFCSGVCRNGPGTCFAGADLYGAP